MRDLVSAAFKQAADAAQAMAQDQQVIDAVVQAGIFWWKPSVAAIMSTVAVMVGRCRTRCTLPRSFRESFSCGT
jgi:hypothetical protein